MILLIPQRLLFNLRYPSYGFKESGVLSNLGTFFQQFDMALEMVCTGEVTNVS